MTLEQFLFATTTPIHFDPDALLRSIDKLMSYNPEVMYLTHFCGIQPTADNVSQLKKSIHAFVDIALSVKDIENQDEAGSSKEGSRVKIIESKLLDWDC